MRSSNFKLIWFLCAIFILGFGPRAFPTEYPPPSCVEYNNMAITICPPDPIPAPPIELIAYSIYANDAFIDNVTVTSPYDTVVYQFEESQLIPGQTDFCVKAVYSDWISEPLCDTDTVIYGMDLPIYEDWSSGSFETNQWTVEGDNWEILTYNGNPAPSVVFNGQPEQQNYRQVLAAYYFIADSSRFRNVYLEYDLRLESASSTGTEFLRMEVWDWADNSWVHWGTFSNHNGSFDWVHQKRNLNVYALGKVCRVRFHVFGSNSGNVAKWYLDNIKIEEVCDEPTEMTLESINPDLSRSLYWSSPFWAYYFDWYHWDDGYNYDAIGTGGAVEFDVAARWDPISYCNYNLTISRIRFFPAEPNAEYTIRIWQDDPPVLLYEQPLPNPEIYEWNDIDLAYGMFFDGGKDLWVGYHIVTTTGYPAGCDNGPAHDGNGNMIYYENKWQTLLQVNPELDFNWNIQAFVLCLNSGSQYFSHYNIYRADGQTGEYEFLDETTHFWTYTDSNVQPDESYCYKIQSVWIDGSDTCESAFSNEACDSLLLETDEISSDPFQLKVFPNPAAEFVIVESDRTIDEVLIYNALGEVVTSYRFHEKKADLNLKPFPDGMYLIKIGAGQEQVTKKLIIMR
jgi:hypothetical protein